MRAALANIGVHGSIGTKADNFAVPDGLAKTRHNVKRTKLVRKVGGPWRTAATDTFRGKRPAFGASACACPTMRESGPAAGSRAGLARAGACLWAGGPG